MSKFALTREQCRELTDLGLNMGLASLCWKRAETKWDLKIKTEEDVEDENTIFTLTESDIIKILPQFIKTEEGKMFEFNLFKDFVGYYDLDDFGTYLFYHFKTTKEEFNLLDGLFKLLKDCLKGGFI